MCQWVREQYVKTPTGSEDQCRGVEREKQERIEELKLFFPLLALGRSALLKGQLSFFLLLLLAFVFVLATHTSPLVDE